MSWKAFSLALLVASLQGQSLPPLPFLEREPCIDGFLDPDLERLPVALLKTVDGKAQALKAEVDRGALGDVYHARSWWIRRSGAPTRPGRSLACWRLGRRWYTTEAAVLEFAEASSAAASDRPADAPRPVGRPRRGADPDGDWCRERFAASRKQDARRKKETDR